MSRIEQQISILKKLGIDSADAKDYLELLDFIDAPDDLIYFGAVLENVAAALEAPRIPELNDAVTNNLISSEKINAYRSQCHRLLEKLKLNSNQEQYLRPLETKVGTILRGYLTKHPFYTVLFMNARDNQELYVAFHQLILFLEILVKSHSQGNKDYRLKTYEKVKISEIFRYFSTDEFVTEWYREINGESCTSMDDFISLIIILINRVEGSKTWVKDANQLLNHCLLLKDILSLGIGIPRRRIDINGGRKRKKKKSKLADITGYSALRGEMLIALTLPDIHNEDDLILSFTPSSEDEIDYDILTSGEDKGEQDAKDIFIFQTAQPIASYVRAFHGRRIASAIIKRIERQNNYLPLSLQALAPIELQDLLININQAAGHNIDQLVKQLIVLTMLFTAAEFKTARDLVNRCQVKSIKEQPTLKYIPRDKCWVIPAYKPNYQTSIKSDPKSGYISHLRLPATSLCVNKFAELENYLFDLHKADKRHSLIDVTESDIRIFLKSIRGGGVTNSRVSNYLLVLGCSVYGQATTTLIFNREPPGSAARNFYTTLSTKLLQERYLHLLGLVAASVGAKLDLTHASEKIGWIGARYRPEISDVSKAINEMLNELANLKTKLTEPDIWIEYHNLYTSYQVLCQSLLTGLRPISSPILKRENLISSAGVYIRKEKSRDDEFNTRHIPVCQAVLDMMENYEWHVQTVKGRLTRKGLNSAHVGNLFFLDDSGRPKPFQPKTYAIYLNKFINLPPNLNRRLLRNFLEENDVSHEVIDVVLGHANLGEQYWGANSTLSMREIRSYMQPYMDKFKVQLGIKTISGLEA